MKPYGRHRRRSYTRKGTARPQPQHTLRGEPQKPASFFARLWALIKGLIK